MIRFYVEETSERSTLADPPLKIIIIREKKVKSNITTGWSQLRLSLPFPRPFAFFSNRETWWIDSPLVSTRDPVERERKTVTSSVYTTCVCPFIQDALCAVCIHSSVFLLKATKLVDFEHLLARTWLAGYLAHPVHLTLNEESFCFICLTVAWKLFMYTHLFRVLLFFFGSCLAYLSIGTKVDNRHFFLCRLNRARNRQQEENIAQSTWSRSIVSRTTGLLQDNADADAAPNREGEWRNSSLFFVTALMVIMFIISIPFRQFNHWVFHVT